MKMLAICSLARSLLLLADGHLFTVSSRGGERALVSPPLLTKSRALSDQGLTLMTSFNLHYLLAGRHST